MGMFGESKKAIRGRLDEAEEALRETRAELDSEKDRFNHWYQAYQVDRVAGGSSAHRNARRADRSRSR